MIISLRDAKYYRASPDNTETIEIPATGWRGEYITTCVIYASLLTAGVKAFPCGNGDDVKLTASQHLSVLEYLKEQREALRGAGPKTLAGWHRTGLNIEDYLLPGDAVDDDMVDHFRDILPPLCNRHDLMQASEPFSSEKDDARELCSEYGLLSPIYSFAKRGGCWFCPNAHDCELRHLRTYHPELWNELLRMSKEPDLVRPGAFRVEESLEEIEDRFYWEEQQMNIFDFLGPPEGGTN